MNVMMETTVKTLPCKRNRSLPCLVARLVGQRVLIQTFVFLTMDGTPEGDELDRRLRLKRPDKEHLGLDEVWLFGATDLKDDPQLVSLLEECKCGHLFHALRSVGPKETGYAQKMRQYIGLAETSTQPVGLNNRCKMIPPASCARKQDVER
jgi:hypothetical protein